jgi:two-component SAPR family response regulator
LLGYCERGELYAKGIAYGQHILRIEQAGESTHRHLMRLHFKAGDRTTALHQFERCVAAVDNEFKLPPCCNHPGHQPA